MGSLPIHAVAEAEYAAALAWYLGRSEQAAAGFATAFAQALETIVAMPGIGMRVDDDHRRWPLRKYPYALVYRTDGARVLIVGVPHDRQLPGDWSSRS